MSDAHQAVEKYTQQKAAQEFELALRHDTLAIAVGVVFVAKADGIRVHAENAAIRDSNSMGIPGEVFVMESCT